MKLIGTQITFRKRRGKKVTQNASRKEKKKEKNAYTTHICPCITVEVIAYAKGLLCCDS